jgi:hypothetical protein
MRIPLRLLVAIIAPVLALVVVTLAVPVSAAMAAAPAPTHTPTSVPTSTPYPTYTPAATATERPSATAYPTYTVVPSPSPIPQGINPTNHHQYCTGLLGWCPDISGLFDAAGGAVVGWIFGGVNALIRSVANLLAGVVRVDQWPSISGFFAFMLKIGGGVALGMAIVGAMLYYRSLMPGGNPKDGALGLGMLTRTLETAVLLLGLSWGIGQLFTVASKLVEQTNAYSGVVAVDALISLVKVFTDAGAVFNPINDVMGVVAFVVYLLIILVKFASVAALAWLVVVAPLVMGTWPLGSSIAARWLSSLMSVLLWGVGWAVWLMLAEAVLTDWTMPPLLKPFLVVALLLFGYGVPRMVDALLASGMARLSGATMATDFAIGAAAGAASGGIGQGLGSVGGRLLRTLR